MQCPITDCTKYEIEIQFVCDCGFWCYQDHPIHADPFDTPTHFSHPYSTSGHKDYDQICTVLLQQSEVVLRGDSVLPWLLLFAWAWTLELKPELSKCQHEFCRSLSQGDYCWHPISTCTGPYSTNTQEQSIVTFCKCTLSIATQKFCKLDTK